MTTEEKKAFLRGTVQILPLGNVKPNEWNPNVVPPHIMESIRSGFTTDGWLVSQALLVWGTDAAGTVRNLIIDGEHRYTAAMQVGLTEGPMVVVDGLTEVEAKALTVKMNQKRGTWDVDALTRLLADLPDLGEVSTAAIDFGFSQDEMSALMTLTEQQIRKFDAAPTAAEVEKQRAGQASLLGAPQVETLSSPQTTRTSQGPQGPQELSEEIIRADVGTKKLRIIIECRDRDHAIAIAERCRAEDWLFTEDFA